MPLGVAERLLLLELLKFLGQVTAAALAPKKIVRSHDDTLNDGRCPGEPRSHATAMSIAVSPPDEYRDSGKRYFFRLENGAAKFRTAEQRNFSEIKADGREFPEIVSYHLKRKGEISRVNVKFDMIAAGGGRVMVKEKGAARFYFTMLDTHFFSPRGTPVPSVYFKLDPEVGQPFADNQDRLDHLAGYSADHPATVRFPLFRIMLSVNSIDNMAVNIDHNLGRWHRIDMRAPQDGADPPDGLSHMPSAVELVTYKDGFGQITTKRGIPIHRVLDIGVGHQHWHEHDCAIYGGEIDSLDGPGLPPLLMERDVYQFFNGPVSDQGGFIDGTANYYVLAQLVSDRVLQRGPRPDAFGILWMDEQAVFSERWRLLHPGDCQFGGSRDLVPSSLVQYLAKTPWYEKIAFDPRKFFCPFRAMHIGRNSRMVVARQVIVVSGCEPESERHLLYSINFSFGTGDHSWRWRELPAGISPQRSTDRNAAPPFEDIGLREDMTLYVVQCNGPGLRVWFQRYLPADCSHFPPEGKLSLPDDQLAGRGAETLARLIAQLGQQVPPEEIPNAPMPCDGFRHPWQSLPEPVWNEIHSRYSHFGCLQEEVNWRSQYYVVEVDPRRIPAGALDKARLEESSGALFIRKRCLNWLQINDGIESIGDAMDQISEHLKVFGQVLRELEGKRQAFDAAIKALEKRMAVAWDDILGFIESLLRKIGSGSRKSARSKIKALVVQEATAVLRDLPVYKAAPKEAKKFIREQLKAVIEGILNADIFDALWQAIAAISGEAASIFRGVRELNDDDDLVPRLSGLVLELIASAVQRHFGGSNARMRIAFRVQLDLGPIHFDERFELGTITLPVDAIVSAVRDAVRGLSVLDKILRQIAGSLEQIFSFVRKTAVEQARRAGIIKDIDQLINPAVVRAQLGSLLQKMSESGSLVQTIHRRPLFNDRFTLKLLHRPPVGYILVHWDKRDDDLLPFNELTPENPKSIALNLRCDNGAAFPVRINRYQQVLIPPVVTRAAIHLLRNAQNEPDVLKVSFTTPKQGRDLDENIWRVRIGALPLVAGHFGAADTFLDVLRHESFVFNTQVRQHILTWRLDGKPAELKRKIARYCSEAGRQMHGTSLWFENVVGHVSTPDELHFL